MAISLFFTNTVLIRTRTKYTISINKVGNQYQLNPATTTTLPPGTVGSCLQKHSSRPFY